MTSTRRNWTRNVFEITLPFTVHLNRQEPDKGHETIISMSVAPLTPKTSTLYLWITRNHTREPEHDGLFRDFSLHVFAQDRVVVESQRPEQIPLDLRDEMHLKVPDASRSSTGDCSPSSVPRERTSSLRSQRAVGAGT